jgi:hypothetical protein
MNENWQEITQIISFGVPILSTNQILAQNSAGATTLPNMMQGLGASIGPNLFNLALALVILVIGWFVALMLASATGSLLKRTNIDNRLANWVTGRSDSAESPPIEKWISSAVFWVVMIFVLVAFFNQLNLTAVSQPLNTFLSQITGFLPRLASALILLAIAWVIATVVKLVVTRSLRSFRLDDRLNQQVGGTSTSSPVILSETLANALYWFILLLFLPSILEALSLQQALIPVQNLLNQILAALPKILEAVIILGAGWLLAQVVRQLVTNLLAATGLDQIGTQVGISPASNGQSLSGIIGTIVYILVLIPIAISALNSLEIAAISGPAIAMLNQILTVIPQIFTAVFILVVAYFIGRFIGDLFTNILTGIGFNNIFYWLGLQNRSIHHPSAQVETPEEGQETVLQDSMVPVRTPSEMGGLIVLIGIMLVATVAATNILNIPALTSIISGILIIAGQILSGLVVFAIGLYLANLAFNLICSAGDRQARILAQTARIAIIALVSAMALQQMGIASNIVNLAFGLLLGSIAVAIAIAFGLGGRDIASEQIRDWLSSFKDSNPPE